MNEPKRLDVPSRRLKMADLFAAMRPVKGEIRRVYKCSECGQLFGRRFIPYGIGSGLTVNACLCQLTSRNVPMRLLRERKP